MAKVYRPTRPKRRRRRVSRRAVLAVSAAGLAAWVTIGVTTAHEPAQPPAPVVGVYPDCSSGVAHADGLPPQCSMPQPAPATTAKAAGGHNMLGGLMAVHALLPHGGGGRPFWRIRRARRWFR